MTRIQNKNFGVSGNDNPRFNWIKFLAPSAVLVTTIILLFILVPSSRQIDDQIPILKNNADQGVVADNKNETRGDILNQSPSQPFGIGAVSGENSVRSSARNNIADNKSINKPMGDPRSVSLDDYIRGGNRPNTIQNGNIVTSGDSEVPYDGYFVVEKPDQNTLLKERARIDSVKKARAKADSLKKVQKMP